MFHHIRQSRDLSSSRSSNHSASRRRRTAVFLLGLLFLLFGAGTSSAKGLGLTPAIPDYAFILESGLFTVNSNETVRVLITDVAESDVGIAVVVRFRDLGSELLSETDGMILPGEPLVVGFTTGGQSQIVRFEIELLSDDVKVAPVTTVERSRGGLTTVDWTCAGPVETPGVDFTCGDPKCCPTAPPSWRFPCGELSLTRVTK